MVIDKLGKIFDNRRKEERRKESRRTVKVKDPNDRRQCERRK